ncbi:hypothetical protein DV515_00008404 [Chloebia gouldiae]|uniref:Uncharacterized protein n=1 Tax=Chloebia gouldiae TaxID=44316 RepID=A0A3L8SFJ4_CHLGU|nr:hypothetical protein DV515_00008404 [Chloebia gouldiae]
MFKAQGFLQKLERVFREYKLGEKDYSPPSSLQNKYHPAINYETPLSCSLTTVKNPSPTTMAITVGVSSTCELGKALGAPSLASPGALLPTAKRGQEWALWCRSRAWRESLVPPVSSALRGGQDCQQRPPGCSCTKPGTCSLPPLQSGLPQLSRVSRPVTASGATTTSKPQAINDLVSQSFADSLWPKAAKSYSALSYCKLPRAERVGSLRNKNVLNWREKSKTSLENSYRLSGGNCNLAFCIEFDTNQRPGLCLNLQLAAQPHRAVGWQEGCLEMRGKTCTVKDAEAFVIKKVQRRGCSAAAKHKQKRCNTDADKKPNALINQSAQVLQGMTQIAKGIEETAATTLGSWVKQNLCIHSRCTAVITSRTEELKGFTIGKPGSRPTLPEQSWLQTMAARTLSTQSLDRARTCLEQQHTWLVHGPLKLFSKVSKNEACRDEGLHLGMGRRSLPERAVVA